MNDRIRKLFFSIDAASKEPSSIEGCFQAILEVLAENVRCTCACFLSDIESIDFIFVGDGAEAEYREYIGTVLATADFGQNNVLWPGSTELEQGKSDDGIPARGMITPLEPHDPAKGLIGLFAFDERDQDYVELVSTVAMPYIAKICDGQTILNSTPAADNAVPKPLERRGIFTDSSSENGEYQKRIRRIARSIIEDVQMSRIAEELRRALRLHTCLISLIDRTENVFFVSGISTKATRADSRFLETMRIELKGLNEAGYSQSDLHKIHNTHIGEYVSAAQKSTRLKSSTMGILEKYTSYSVIRIPLFDSFRRLQGFVVLAREPHQKRFASEMDLARDIGSRFSDAFEIRNSIYFDNLTGLPNLRRIRPVAMDNLISSEPFCLLLCKITNLKDLVIARGDEVVDRCIIATAGRIKSFIRQRSRSTQVGRNSGEASFSFIIPGDDRKRLESFAEGLIESITAPLEIGSSTIFLQVSIGACFSLDIWESDMLFNYCKLAIQAIAVRTNTFCVFDAEMQQAYQDEIELEGDLLSSITQKDFLPHYQPKVLCDGSIIGYEALVRWVRNDSIEYPGLFVDKMERMGLIQDLFEIVFEKVCTELSSGVDLRSVSVNISPSQLANRNMVEKITTLVTKYDIDPSKITFEFVETAIVNNEYFATIQELKKLGFKLSLDDFGTGYARYKTLIDLFNQGFINEIKIDKVFVDSIQSVANQNFIRSISFLASEFDIRVVIEGVETLEQYQLLKVLDPGCIIQGWLVSRAMPVEEVGGFDENRIQTMFHET